MELVIAFPGGSSPDESSVRVAQNCGISLSQDMARELQPENINLRIGISPDSRGFIALYDDEIPVEKKDGILETLKLAVPVLLGINNPEIYVGSQAAHV